MKTVDYLTAQATLAKTMRQVCENDIPITINGAGKDEVVMMSVEAFEKLRYDIQNDRKTSHEVASISN